MRSYHAFSSPLPQLGRMAVALLLIAVAVAGLGISHSDAGATPTLAVKVQGNALVDGAGNPLRLIGVGYQGPEYFCVPGWGVFDGPSDLASVQAMARWHIN